MKSKILSNTIFIIFIAIIISLGVFSFFQHNKNSQQAVDDMNRLLKIVVNESEGKSENEIFEKIDYISKLDNRYRFTIIDNKGIVLYDSKVILSKLDNHLYRDEVNQLKKLKIGKSKRYSKTLGKEYQYMSTYLNKNSIIRISTELNSPLKMVTSALTIVFIITIIATYITYILISKLLDKSFNNIEMVAKSIDLQSFNNNALDSEEDFEEEIKPLINIIKNQNRDISIYIKKLKDKIIEMNEILNNMNEGLIMLDEFNKIVSINESAIRLLKIENINLFEGKEILDIFYDENLEKILSGEKHISIINIDKNMYLKIYISDVCDSEYKRRGKIIFIVDISSTYLDEKYRREFSTNISHELKTPLTSINGYAEMIYLGLASEDDIKNFSKIIYTQGNKLLDLIDDIIKLSKLDEEYQPYKEKTIINLNENIEKIVDMLKPQALDKNIVINYDLKEKIQIIGMKILIDEILQNILSNAIKYNKIGGQIDIYMKENYNSIEIIVKDTGIGIEKDDLDRVFERFYKVDKSRTNINSSSTGLGLAIVKHAAKIMNAQVYIDSQINIGTNVIINIPKE